jgi:sulfur-oxidizing protein SoxY
MKMSANLKRRVFLKGSVAAGTLGVAVGAGLLTPGAVMAAWPAEAFGAKKVEDALSSLLGTSETTPSEDIKI